MDDNGHMISNTSWNLNKFSEYYSSIFYRDDLACDLCSSEFAGVHDQPFTVSEVAAAIMDQKSGGAVGIDGLSAEVLKAAKFVVAPWLTRFFNATRLNKYCPDDLVCGLIVPLYKSGKPAGIPKSFRPVMLLSVVRKILTTLLTKITPSMQNYVRDTQSGFRPKHSTADEVFYTRMMCERSLLGDWSYPGASLDFSGAFDTVVRESALERLKESGASTSTVSTLISI